MTVDETPPPVLSAPPAFADFAAPRRGFGFGPRRFPRCPRRDIIRSLSLSGRVLRHCSNSRQKTRPRLRLARRLNQRRPQPVLDAQLRNAAATHAPRVAREIS